MWCSFCGSNRHTIKNCPKTWNGQANRNHMRCSYCGSRKHNINACEKTFNGNANMAWNKVKIKDDYVMD